MIDITRELQSAYTRALEDYLEGAGEEALHRAYELGRRALAEGLGILDMAGIHHSALKELLCTELNSGEAARRVSAVEDFFVESLSSFEMTHRGVREANTALLRLNEILEEEAKRIAHALHDEAGQLLAAVYLAVGEVADELPPPARERLAHVSELLDDIDEQIRRISHELRPTILDDLGLLPALEFLAEGVSKRTGLPISVEGPMEGRFPSSVETTLYRVVQEALTNITKHARATRACVRLRWDGHTIQCVVRDNGTGFDPSAVSARTGERGLGLIGIRERLDLLGGRLEITSAPGQGTTLVVTIPTEKTDVD